MIEAGGQDSSMLGKITNTANVSAHVRTLMKVNQCAAYCLYKCPCHNCCGGS